MGGLVESLMKLLAQDQQEEIYMGATRVWGPARQCMGVFVWSGVKNVLARRELPDSLRLRR